MASSQQYKTFSDDGIIDGFVIHQDTLDQLDRYYQTIAKSLIRQRRWILIP